VESVVTVGESCPISGVKIDASAGRVNGVLTTALLVVALVTPARWVLAVLAVDFAVKVFVGFRYGPLCLLSQVIARAACLPRRKVDAGPKRFAALMGLVFCLAGIALGVVLWLPVAYYLVVGMCAGCAALEGFAGFCVGCTIYGLLPPGLRRASHG